MDHPASRDEPSRLQLWLRAFIRTRSVLGWILRYLKLKLSAIQRIIRWITSAIERVIAPPFRVPTAAEALAQGYTPGTLGPPLPRSAMDSARWYTDRLTRFRTEAQQRRAECAQQPTISNHIWLDSNTSIRRERPRIGTPPPGRAPNDYDALLDMRVVSPNGKPVGFWDWDREEIERENAFTPLMSDSPELYSLSPSPVPGFLGALTNTSLADSSIPSRSPARIPAHRGPPVSGMDQLRAQEQVSRFRALPREYHLAIQMIIQYGGVAWGEALEMAEEQHKRDQLVPTQQEVYDKVKSLEQSVHQLLAKMEKEDDELSHDFRVILQVGWLDLPDEARNVLREAHDTGAEMMLDGEGGEVFGQQFWLAVVDVVGEQKSCAGLRQVAVLQILCLKRIDNLEFIKYDIDDWVSAVGDRGKELAGVYERGDFWTTVPEEFEQLLNEAKNLYCWIKDDHATEIERLELELLMSVGCSTRPRADVVSREEW